jgi:hypothetical protein
MIIKISLDTNQLKLKDLIKSKQARSDGQILMRVLSERLTER